MVTIENLEANLRTLFSLAGVGGAAAEADFDATTLAGGGRVALAPSAPPREPDEEDKQIAAAIAASLKTEAKLSPAGGGAAAVAVAPSAPPAEDPDFDAAIAASNDQIGKDRNANELRAQHRAIVPNDEMAAQQVALAQQANLGVKSTGFYAE